MFLLVSVNLYYRLFFRCVLITGLISLPFSRSQWVSNPNTSPCTTVSDCLIMTPSSRHKKTCMQPFRRAIDRAQQVVGYTLVSGGTNVVADSRRRSGESNWARTQFYGTGDACSEQFTVSTPNTTYYLMP